MADILDQIAHEFKMFLPLAPQNLAMQLEPYPVDEFSKQ